LGWARLPVFVSLFLFSKQTKTIRIQMNLNSNSQALKQLNLCTSMHGQTC
jgi:hypothetical protein